MTSKEALLETYTDTFEPALMKELSERSKYLHVDANEVLMEVGQTVNYVPLVVSGILKVSRIDESGNELLLYYVNPKESCAMTFTCCMQQHPSEVRATAEEECEILMVPIELMDQWITKYATWKSFVMRTIRFRFHELIVALDQIAFQSLDERLIHYLKQKHKTTGSALINLSHEQIANDLASSRVVISRLLKKLENDKKVLLYRNQVKLLSAFLTE
jgi:CRP/FNR family transcriptional regulator, anaerobic regulatory protein